MKRKRKLYSLLGGLPALGNNKIKKEGQGGRDEDETRKKQRKRDEKRETEDKK